jgi:hypothetical protein
MKICPPLLFEYRGREWCARLDPSGYHGVSVFDVSDPSFMSGNGLRDLSVRGIISSDEESRLRARLKSWILYGGETQA